MKNRSEQDIKKSYCNRRISKRVAIGQLCNSSEPRQLSRAQARGIVSGWNKERPAKVRNANNLGVKTGAKGKREQQAA